VQVFRKSLLPLGSFTLYDDRPATVVVCVEPQRV